MKQLILAMILMTGFMAFAQAPDVAPTMVVSASAPADDVLMPPAWLATALKTIESMPIIGPVAVEVFKWLGVIASIATALVTFLVAVIRALSVVLSAARMLALANMIAAFESSKIMYWLKFFSIYNAKEKK